MMVTVGKQEEAPKEKATITAALTTKKMPGDPDYDANKAAAEEIKKKGSIRGMRKIIRT